MSGHQYNNDDLRLETKGSHQCPVQSNRETHISRRYKFASNNQSDSNIDVGTSLVLIGEISRKELQIVTDLILSL